MVHCFLRGSGGLVWLRGSLVCVGMISGYDAVVVSKLGAQREDYISLFVKDESNFKG